MRGLCIITLPSLTGRIATVHSPLEGESWKEAQEKSVRAANNTLEGLQLQTWIMNNLLTEKCWYRSHLSVSGFLYKCFLLFVSLSSSISFSGFLKSAKSEIRTVSEISYV